VNKTSAHTSPHRRKNLCVAESSPFKQTKVSKHIAITDAKHVWFGRFFKVVFIAANQPKTANHREKHC